MKALLNRVRRKEKNALPETPWFHRGDFPDATERQFEILDSVKDLTMTSPARVFALCEAVENLVKNNIEGDFVECGVWRGGSSSAAAQTLLDFSDTSRTLWMYDTFEGMSEPTDSDVDCLGHAASHLLDQQQRQDETSIWCYSPLEQVKRTMLETGYPTDQLRFVVGKVEDTLPQQIPEKIALLRLDTDWYESTRCELEYLFPRLVPGGVLIVDDYGHWEGCRKAVDEYFEENQISMLLNRIDYSGKIGVNCPV